MPSLNLSLSFKSNKVEIIPPANVEPEVNIEEIVQNTLKELDLPQDTKYFVISAATGQNVKNLLAEAMDLIEEIQTQENERQAEEEAQAKSSSFVWTSPRERMSQRVHDDWEDDWDEDWDDEFEDDLDDVSEGSDDLDELSTEDFDEEYDEDFDEEYSDDEESDETDENNNK